MADKTRYTANLVSENNLYVDITTDKVGVGTTNPTSKLTIVGATTSQAIDIGTDFLVSGSGAFNPRVTIASTVGAASTQKMEISAVSRDRGLLEIANYGGNQLFSVSNNQNEDAFAVNRYADYTNSAYPVFENRSLFRVGQLGIVTTYGGLRVGTSYTQADSLIYNEMYGRLNVRSSFSTSTAYVSIVPRSSDSGALSFETPVGTAQTDRGTQVFSISNNFSSSIFRINDLNRNPIFEVNTNGRIGIGTVIPYVGLDVNTNTQFRQRISFSEDDNPSTNDVIDITPYSTGVSTFAPSGGAIVITENRINNRLNSSQLFTIENNNNTLFRINTVGFGLTTIASSTSGTKPINPVIDVDRTGEVKIFDVGTKKILSTSAGFSTVIPDDGDLFRIDSYVTPFIGSFPTVSKAIRVDKFGTIELNRNIIQISGITTVSLGSTSSPSINSTMSFELTNNTTLTVRVRGTDGTVRTGIITLS